MDRRLGIAALSCAPRASKQQRQAREPTLEKVPSSAQRNRSCRGKRHRNGARHVSPFNTYPKAHGVPRPKCPIRGIGRQSWTATTRTPMRRVNAPSRRSETGMDGTNNDPSAATERLRRNACRLAATEAWLPLVACRIRRCRRSRTCLGRFAPMLAADGRRSRHLPLCIATASRHSVLRYCSRFEAVCRALAETPGNPTCSRKADRPDERAWPWPPLPVAAIGSPGRETPGRRCGYLRPRPARPGT